MFICVQGVFVAFALVLELVAQQGLLGAHGREPDLVFVVVTVLAQTVEAVLLSVGLGRAYAEDDAPSDGQSSHSCSWRRGKKKRKRKKNIPQ